MSIWQRRFYAQPKVYLVEDRDGLCDGVYESREAAQLAVDHDKRSRLYYQAGFRIVVHHIYSLELSRERWKEPQP